MVVMKWHLNFKPWAVQVEAMRRSAGSDKYGYMLEMGLGKSAIALNDYVDDPDVDLCIVIAPQSFKLSWPAFVSDYGLDLQTGYWPRDRLPTEWDRGLYALNYESFSRPNSKLKAPLYKLLERRRTLLVLDESKALGNPQSGWTKCSIELAKRATKVRLLNGTPVTQNPQDLYGQLRALGQLGGMLPISFRNRFCVLGGYMGKVIQPQVRNEDELGRILDACSFRALKADWRADLPPKSYSTIDLELTDRQRVHYKTMLKEFYAQVGDADVTANMVITQLGKLRQISSGVLLDDDTEVVFEPVATNPKVQAVKEIVGNTYGKTIVVHYHKVSGRMLLDALASFNPAYLHGGMEPEEIVEQKRRFNDDPDCRVIVGQERAMALGHTLLGQPGRDRCTRTVFFESSFSLYYRSQLEDRNHRGDADEPVTVYDLVASPVERVVLQALKAKKDLAAVIDNIVAAVREELK